MIKSVLYQQNPLMILFDKIQFDDLVKFEEGEEGEKYDNRKTISLEEAFKRLLILFPELKNREFVKEINYIIKKRNFLMHNFGHIEIGTLEKKVQIKIADISESIYRY
ncbi:MULTISPECIES: hypothetical protein [Spirulina sp. CCY15215]|uniref:hypothetical protein n=1 Tax=Spirulina sp. CCY15215 TaxID=2767591 RepID=UPI001951D12E|nr:hypothetical protein [Spirulina major]